jgi:hypothetical protein
VEADADIDVDGDGDAEVDCSLPRVPSGGSPLAFGVFALSLLGLARRRSARR